jgi:diguanylate cyclase (GGDEF)-like protein
MDILGRVARQLDRGLLEATLVTRVLQDGVAAETLDAAATRILGVFSRIADAELLGLAMTNGVTLQVYLERPAKARTRLETGKVAEFLAGLLEVPDGHDLVLRLDGEPGDDGPLLDVETASSYPLVLRQARGCLLVWPQQEHEEDWGRTESLIEPAVPHAALVIDSARLADHLRRLSTHDGLTRLLNHRSVLERLDEEIGRAQRYDGKLTVALCDLDRFKRLNDRYGHLVGDEVLREFAVRLRGSVRISDVVGRYGGEEFLLVLPNTELDDGARTVGRMCRSMVEEPMRLVSVEGPVEVTASFGVASLGEVAGDRIAERLLALADERLYQAKREGRARVVDGRDE